MIIEGVVRFTVVSFCSSATPPVATSSVDASAVRRHPIGAGGRSGVVPDTPGALTPRCRWRTLTTTSEVPIPPGYPAEWDADVVLSDGGTVRIRPIRPDDGPASSTSTAASRPRASTSATSRPTPG